MMAAGDNPPVGLVLCTHRDDTRVEYAIAGLDNKLFVSKHQVVLPSERQLENFLRAERDRTILQIKEARARYGV